MNYGIQISGMAAMLENTRVGVIANNIANINTTGYRRDTVSFKERLAEALEGQNGRRFYNPLIDRSGGAPLIEQIAFDRSAGPVQTTENPLDVSIRGDAFFTVREISTGKTFYTRNGNFTLDPEGRMTTQDGKCFVLSSGGEPIAIGEGSADGIRVDDTGKVHVRNTGTNQDEMVGMFALARFNDMSGLHKSGDTLFENRGGEPQQAEDVKVAQGTLEGSSVNPILELADMIKSQRMLETHLRMITIQDGTLDRAVNDLGRPAR